MVAQIVPAPAPDPIAVVHPVADAPTDLDPSRLLGEPVNLADCCRRGWNAADA
jgi:hypothetical protein